MRIPRDSTGKNGHKIRIEKPSIQSLEEEQLWRRVHKFAEMIPTESEPNLGRVREIKDELKKGTYLNSEVIEETAARLAARLMRPE